MRSEQQFLKTICFTTSATYKRKDWQTEGRTKEGIESPCVCVYTFSFWHHKTTATFPERKCMEQGGSGNRKLDVAGVIIMYFFCNSFFDIYWKCGQYDLYHSCNSSILCLFCNKICECSVRQVMWCALGLSAFDELLIIFTGKMSFRVILCVCDEGVGEIQHSLSVILRPNYICQK